MTLESVNSSRLGLGLQAVKDSRRGGKIIKNAVSAAGRIAKAVVTARKITVSPEEQERRLAICHVCEWFEFNKCMKCGCVARWKTKLATEHCPDTPPRW